MNYSNLLEKITNTNYITILEKITPIKVDMTHVTITLLVSSLIIGYFNPVIGVLLSIMGAMYHSLSVAAGTQYIMLTCDKWASVEVVDGVEVHVTPDWIIDKFGDAFCSFDKVYISRTMFEHKSIVQHEVYHAKSSYSIFLLAELFIVDLSYTTGAIIVNSIYGIEAGLAVALLSATVIKVSLNLISREETNADKHGILNSEDSGIYDFISDYGKNNPIPGWKYSIFSKYPATKKRLRLIREYEAMRTKNTVSETV